MDPEGAASRSERHPRTAVASRSCLETAPLGPSKSQLKKGSSRDGDLFCNRFYERKCRKSLKISAPIF